jgi:hypothetical protein
MMGFVVNSKKKKNNFVKLHIMDLYHTITIIIILMFPK